MNYLDFLKALLALGPKLPAVFALIEHIVGDLQELTALIAGGPFAAPCMSRSSTPEETTLENEVAAALVADGTNRGIGDGTFLRAIWAFIESHPELVTLLLSLFAKSSCMNPYQSPTIESEPMCQHFAFGEVFLLGFTVGAWGAVAFVVAINVWFFERVPQILAL